MITPVSRSRLRELLPNDADGNAPWMYRQLSENAKVTEIATFGPLMTYQIAQLVRLESATHKECAQMLNRLQAVGLIQFTKEPQMHQALSLFCITLTQERHAWRPDTFHVP